MLNAKAMGPPRACAESPRRDAGRRPEGRLAFVLESMLWSTKARRPGAGAMSFSRRGLQAPYYRITRSTRWAENVNPWKETDRLPLLSGGLLAELIYGDEPRLFNDLRVSDDDPAAEYLAEYRSLAA